MKTIIAIFLFLFILVTMAFSQSNGTTKPFTLQGKIIGQDSGKIIFEYQCVDGYIRDTAAIINGEFMFKGNIDEPTNAWIKGGNNLNTTRIYLESGVLKVNLLKDKFDKLEVTGSKTQDESNELILIKDPINFKMAILRSQRDCINDTIEKTKDELMLKRMKKNYAEKDNQIEQLRGQNHANDIAFIRTHPKSFISLELLENEVSNDLTPLDSSKTLYKGLDLISQNSIYGKELKKIIVEKGKSAVGAIAPDFKTTDLNNKTLTLSQFQGKNEVLLVFWASYCVPCRASFPHLKEIYKKYHSKGLEIILVSVDNNKEAWIEAVNQESIGMWHQIHYSGSFDKNKRILGNIRENYYVFGIPAELLIDKTGKIIARYRGVDEKLAALFKD